MARLLGSLVLQTQIDNKRLNKGATQASSRTKKLENTMRSSARRMSAALAGIGVGVAVGFLGRATSEAIKFGDQVQKTALRTGLTTEAISELGFVAERGGTSLEAIVKAVQKVQRAAIDAGDGLLTYTRAFDKLNINVSEFKQLAPDRQFEVVADRISKLENPTERTALSMQLLGRSGAELISVFSGGVGEIRALRQEAVRLGVSLSQDAADKAAGAADAITNLQTSIRGASLNLVSDMLPAITKLAEGLQDVLIPAIGKSISAFTTFGTFLGVLAAAAVSDGVSLKNAFDVLDTRGIDELIKKQKELSATIKKTQSTIDKQISSNFFKSADNNLITANLIARKDLLDVEQKISALRKDAKVDFVGPVFQKKSAVLASGATNAPGSSTKSTAQRAKETSTAIVTGLREELALSKALTEEDKFRVELQQGRFKNLIGTDKIVGVQLANEIKASEAIVAARKIQIDQDKEREDLATSVIAGLEEQVATYNLVTEAANIRFQLEEGAYKSLNGLHKTRINDLASELEQLEKASAAAEAAAKLQEETAKASAAAAQEFGNVFSSAFEDAIVSGSSFRDLLKGIEDDLIRIFARKLVTEPLQELLGGALGSLGGGGGGFFSKIFGGGKASGGPVQSGKSFLVGEKGPELFSPTRNGFITPNSALSGASQSISINVVTPDANSFLKSTQQIAAAAGRALAIAQRNR
jgi:hypothetical protein